ncbi:DNA translocase FtsK 4TM domain-containing protein [Aliiroseovarius sp. YM-037]|uniref:DNA translocase FtsK 4TM domain-containing protein n=1 Tax=Aliiroseovarius sp. YM-037 TaxID=3341728 RepID=UPI003A7FD2FD
MASYQARQRDPLLDQNTQAVLERRGKELLGVGLMIVGVAFVLMLASYSPDDPSWFSATDAEVQNTLGRLGASIASPLYIIAGWGSWGIAAVLLAWGARFVTHRGQDRAIGRLIFAPIGIALISIYASTLMKTTDWSHSFGLGGLFGDAFSGAVLSVLQEWGGIAIWLKLLSAASGLGMIAMMLYVLGVTGPELRRFGRFLLLGLVMTYAMMLRLLGKGARGAAMAARSVNDSRLERREYKLAQAEAAELEAMHGPAAAATPNARVLRADPRYGDDVEIVDDFDEPAPAKPGLLASLMRRAPEAEPEPELIEPTPLDPEVDMEGGEDRIKAKIADVIKARVRQPALTIGRAEPQLTRGRGPQPLILDAQPPLQAGSDYADAAYDDDPQDTQMFEAEDMPEPIAPPVVEPTKAKVINPPRKPVQPSRQARAEAQPALQFEDRKAPAYEHPPLSLLTNPVQIERHHLSDEALEENARMLESVLDDYGVKGEIVSVRPGPVVTMYELEPAPGLKASRVIGLADDIARSMSALSARVSTVPGRSVIGIELPNSNREMVVLREILAARDFGDSNMRLPLALGKDIGGDPIVANLAKMPHLLIAGTTGSGKSVAINTMILSLLYKLSPEECRLIMIDPKMLELSVYDGIPHLLSPVVTDPKKAVVALKWTVGEMEERYRKMSKMGVRNIEGYNGRVKDALSKGEMFSRTVQTGFDDETGDPIFETEEITPEAMPYIVVIVDEMADLMMVAGKEIEACIQRLAQMARASGIHLIMATQRPSVDVITGTIKANFPTRISFQVTSKIDSRTILGEQGAEQLLGMGDMLYMAGGAKITRIHGPFCSDEEVEEIVTYLKGFGPPEYMSGVTDGPDEDKESDIDLVLGLGGNTDGEDALYDQAVAIVIKDRKCSTSYIQRKLAIGYNKAARLVEQMEDQGLVSSANHVGKREILVPEQG